VRVVTWNLLAPEFARPGKNGRDFYVRTREWLGWEGRLRRILARLDAVDADLLLLQEVSKVHWERTIRDALQVRGYDVRFAPRPGTRADGVALAVRSPWRIDESQAWTLEDDSQKACLLARVSADGARSFVAASVHLKWAEPDDLPAGQLARVVTRIEAMGPGPALVAGDLNFDVVGSTTWPELAGKGWTSAYADDPSPTWSADGRARKLDAMLLRGIGIRRVEALPSINPEVGLPSASEPSDHLPLVVDLAF